LPVFYDDDDDEERSDSFDDNIISGLPLFFAITPDEPVISTEEPDNSLSMGDEHLDTIPGTESDEFIKSGVETLIPIPSESEGIPEHVCDVPFHDNSLPLNVSKDQIEDFSDLEVMEIVISEVRGIDNDILLTIKDDILREKLLNVNLLISKIEALNANPIPSSDCKTKSSFTSLNSILEETNTFDNSLPEFETFCFDVEEISSGSTTTHPDLSLLEYKVFYDDHFKEISSDSPTTHSDSSLYASFIFDLSINLFPPADRSDSYEFTDELIPFISPPEYDCFIFKVEPNSRDFTKDVVEDISLTKEPQVLNALPTHPSLQLNIKFHPSSEYLFTYVVWIFLHFLVYSVAHPYLLSLRNEDTIFDLGICNLTFSRLDISHRYGTVKTFTTHCSHLNKCPMLIHRQNNPPLDVLLFHFIPLDSLKENVSKTDDRIDKLADQILTLVDIFAKKVVTPAPDKAVKESCVTYGGNHAYYNCPNTVSNQPSVCVATGTYNQVAPQNRASNYMAPPGFALNQSLTSGTLSSNTILNPKGEMKAITTQSGVAYEGPLTPTPKKVVKRETEETTDKEQTNFQGSTTHIQPLVIPIPELEIPKTLPKPNIPYPSRLNDQKLCEKATNQMENFFQIFQDLHFDISFVDALLLMPKFASMIKNLLTNKDKFFELAKIPLNKNCSAMLLKKLPQKLGDPGKFLIPCDFPGMDVCHALADLGASINLMPFSIWKKLSLPELTPTQMTLELADRSITHPKGVSKEFLSKWGRRSFLRTSRALIDVYREEITLRVNDEAVTFNLNQTTRYSSTYDDLSVNRIDIIDAAREEYAQEILGFSNSLGGNPTSTFEPILSDSSLSLTPFEGSDFILEEIEAYLKDESISSEIDHADCDPEGDICIDKLQVIITKDLKVNEKEALLKVLKSHKRAIAWKITDIKGIDPRFGTYKILMEEDYKSAVQSQRRVKPKIHEKGGITIVENKNNELIPTRLVTGWRVCIDYRKLNDETNKDHFPLPFMDQMLEQLAENEFYCFLDGFYGYFQFPINPPDQEKTTFTYHYGTFAYRIMPFGLCNAPETFQRCMMAIFHDMIEKTMEVYMDDFLVFGDSFSSCLSHLDTMLQSFRTRKTKHFQPIHYASKTMTEAQIHYTTTAKEMLTIVYAFKKFRPYLVLSKSIVYTDHSSLKYLLSKKDTKPRLIRRVLLLQEFDIVIRDKKGTKNLATDHLSRLENPHKDVFENKDINENFPLETLGNISIRSTSWFADFANFHAGNFIVKEMSSRGKVEVSNRDLKCILERTVGENCASWSEKLDDALWAFRTAYKTPIGCTLYTLVYGKSCHLPIELEHKAYWALKHVNFDLKTAGDHRKLQLNELNELRDQAYENYLIYKEKTKKLHDSKIKNRIFNVGDWVLLFNSCLKIFLGKLKTHWSGPFTITKVFPYATVELSQPDGPNFKVNGIM
nr:reverse transcriptase domain-containing protein [Tanacetum cinerariifolium]